MRWHQLDMELHIPSTTVCHLLYMTTTCHRVQKYLFIKWEAFTSVVYSYCWLLCGTFRKIFPQITRCRFSAIRKIPFPLWLMYRVVYGECCWNTADGTDRAFAYTNFQYTYSCPALFRTKLSESPRDFSTVYCSIKLFFVSTAISIYQPLWKLHGFKLK